MVVKKQYDVKEIKNLYEELNAPLKPRLLGTKPDYDYVWVHNHPSLVAKYIALGWRLATKSDVEVEGTKPDAEGHWQTGLDILMMIERAKRENMIRKAEMLSAFQLGKLKDEFHDEAYRQGVPSVEVEQKEERKIKVIKA